jgi:PAS domain S-box-containing protein
MPGMNGIELLKTIRKNDSDIPLIIFTGKGRESVVIEALNNGADFYLQKGTDTKSVYSELVGKILSAVRRNLAEQTLIENERRYREVAECTNEYLWDVDPQGLYTYVSPFMEKMLGYRPDEVIGKLHFYDLFMPETREKLKDLAFQAFERGESFHGFINPNLRKDGKMVFLETDGLPIFDAHGALQGYRGADRDVTKRIFVEEQLRLESHFLNQVSEAVVALDMDRRIIFWNTAAETMYQWSKDEVIGKKVVDIILPLESRSHVERHLYDVMSTGMGRGEYLVKRKDGTPLTVQISTSMIFDADGKPVAIVGVSFDLSERKRQADAVKESEEVMRYIVKHDWIAIAVYDDDLHYIAVSDRYLKDYGVREEDIIGKHHYEVFPEMPQKWRDVHQRVLKGAIERNDDDFFERQDGTITKNRWECRPWYRKDGSIGGMITYTDVTGKGVKRSSGELSEDR